jgi:hypothetical protein
MASKSIKKELEQYMPLLTKKQQSLIPEMVKNILQVEPAGKRISLEKYNQELNQSIKQAVNGKTTSHARLLKEMENW